VFLINQLLCLQVEIRSTKRFFRRIFIYSSIDAE
jgi:hypothetical protein